MRAQSRRAALQSAALALAAADAGARLLSPDERLPEPARIDLREYFSVEEIARGARYARRQLALGLGRSAMQLAVLGVAARRLPARAPSALSVRLPTAGHGALVAARLALSTTAASLPLAAVARRRALAVGLATQSWRGWALDLVKAGAIEAGLAGGAGATLSALIERYPRSWWLPGAAGGVAVGTGLGVLAPVLLDPLFNDFTPLPPGRLREQILDLAARCGVRVGQVYVVDASRRTTGANAYVTGLGPTKRVVLFDTLLERYSPEEVVGVIAHELAHVRHRDVARGVLYGAIVAGPAGLATQRLAGLLAPGAKPAAALPAVGVAASLIAAPTGVFANRLSRALERQADAYALKLSGTPAAVVSFERAVAVQNVADLDPPRWVTRLLATHPPTAERIGAAIAAADGVRPAGPRTRAGS